MKIQRHVCQKFSIPHYNGVTWVSWHLKSPATLWFVQHFVWAYIEGNMKAWLTDPLWTESTCDGLFVRRIQCWLVDFLHKGPVMQNLLWGHHALSLSIYIYMICGDIYGGFLANMSVDYHRCEHKASINVETCDTLNMFWQLLLCLIYSIKSFKILWV